VSVSMSARISPEPHARSLPFFVHVAYVRGLVLLQHVDDRPHRLSAARGDGSAQRGHSVGLIYNCLVSTSSTVQHCNVNLYTILSRYTCFSTVFVSLQVSFTTSSYKFDENIVNSTPQSLADAKVPCSNAAKTRNPLN